MPRMPDGYEGTHIAAVKATRPVMILGKHIDLHPITRDIVCAHSSNESRYIP